MDALPPRLQNIARAAGREFRGESDAAPALTPEAAKALETLAENYRRQQERLRGLPADATPEQICAALTGGAASGEKITAGKVRDSLTALKESNQKTLSGLQSAVDALKETAAARAAAVGQWESARTALAALDAASKAEGGMPATAEQILQALLTEPAKEE